jgi:thioredoxin-disulfide reductase
MKEKDYETIIIGAGIAGLTAAIYAARKRMSYLVISEDFGGQMNVSGEVLNYPGIIQTTGADFRSILKKQIEFNKVKVNEGESVKKVEQVGDNFKVISDKAEYQAKSLIIASGSRPRKLSVPGEEEFTNKGVHYCAICDGPLYSGKKVAVIGGGNSALEAVDFLLNIAERIYLVNIGEKLKAYEYLIERIEKQEKVKIINNAKTTEIFGNKFVRGLKYDQGGVAKELEVDAVFIEIGRVPNVDFVKDLVEVDEEGHIKVDCWARTNIPGIFAAGDCTDVHEYQYVISAGQGCIALIKTAKYLAGMK